MDRRQKKTRKAIFSAFSDLLDKKRYNAITVQEIIDEANVGRTTFYAHFETKDMLLKTMCEDIFEHIFSAEDRKKDEHAGFEATLAHILFHLKHNEVDVARILSSEGEKEFIKYFKVHIDSFFFEHVKQLKSELPQDFLLSFLVDGFISAAKWWIVTKSPHTPGQMAGYYMSAVNI